MTRRIHRKGLRHCIRLFSPAWFSINMGTGSVSILAALFHWGNGGTALKVISLTFFFINLFFYIVILLMTVTRYWMFPELWIEMLYEPGEGLFIGAFPIGSASLIDLAVILNQRWHFGGDGFLYTLWGFWWLILCCAYWTSFGMIYILMSSRSHMISETTSCWVLPIIPLIVLSATGGSLSLALMSHSTTLSMLTVAFSLASYCAGMSITLMMISLYLTRLILRGTSMPHVILASFIITSPLGQGGYSLLLNGEALSMVFPRQTGVHFPSLTIAGEILYVGCFMGAWTLWCMGFAWIIISLSSIYVTARRSKIPFTLSYLGLVFPNGVFALCSVRLGVVLDSRFCHYFGAIWSIFVLILWIICIIPTMTHLWDTSIFIDSPSSEVWRQDGGFPTFYQRENADLAKTTC